MKILIIYPNNEIITGGHLYDHYLINRIIANQGVSVELLTDDKLGNSNKYLYNFYYLNYLRKYNDYDIILTNSRLYSRLFIPFLYLRLIHSKIELISLHHLFSFLSEKAMRKPIHKFLELSFLRLCHKVIIPSPYILDLMKKYLPKKRNLYMSLAFKNETEKRYSTLDQNKILFVGTIEPRKGVEYLLEALSRLQKEQVTFTCDVVGKIQDKVYYQKLLSYIEENNLQNIVYFRGHIYDREELNNYYQQASCFAFPSLHEGFGIVLLEAMSFGVPVVTFNNTAMPYTIVPNVNGLLAENKNSEDLKEQIKRILLDVPFRQSLGKGAIATFAQSKTYADLDNEIEHLIQSNFNSCS